MPWLYRAQSKMLAILAWDKRMKSKMRQEVTAIHSDGSPMGSFDMDDCQRQKLTFKSSDKQYLQHSRFNCGKLEEKEWI